MNATSRRPWITAMVLAIPLISPGRAVAHPGTGIVVDRLGQVYFVDMVSGVWKVDTRGVLTHIPGPSFHWMTLDADDRFAAVRLPSGAGGDIVRLGAAPTLLLASDVPVAMGRDGSLYYPSHGGSGPAQILKIAPSGERSIHATLTATGARGPLRELNGLAAAPDGSLYYTEADAIRRVDRDGRVSTIAEHVAPDRCEPVPGLEAEDGPLLRGLDIDADGTVYVAATRCASVLRVTPSGKVTTLLQGDSTWSPTGVALSGTDVYVLEFQGVASDDRPRMVPRVRKVNRDGDAVVIATVTRRQD